MRVCPETGACGDAVLVDDAQGADGVVFGGVVGGEGEGVEGVEPAVVCEASGAGGAGCYFLGGWHGVGFCDCRD